MFNICGFKIEIQSITANRVLWHDYSSHKNFWSWINYDQSVPYAIIRGKDYSVDQLNKEL